MIPFNKPCIIGNELDYISKSFASNKLSGNGFFTKKCQTFFEEKFNFKKSILTTSCTDALEMSALLSEIKEGDEVIVPSYTFVSSALAFVREGAKIVFADSRIDHPGLDEDELDKLLTKKTKALVIVHYAGVSCDMDKIMSFVKKNNLILIEDAAQAIDSYYKGKPLGSFGDFATFSFHETKNIICGEGGLLVVNNEKYIKRAEVIWEKGTNRSEFFRGEVNKYGWVDTGSSFLPSELNAAFLWGQLQNLKKIQKRRIDIWNLYYDGLCQINKKTGIKLPKLPDYSTNNGHMFYLICDSLDQRRNLIKFLKEKGVHAVFHYLSLHKSEYYQSNLKEKSKDLPNSDFYTNTLLRLPLFYNLTDKEVFKIIESINEFTDI